MAYNRTFIQNVVKYAKKHSVLSTSKKFDINNEIIERWLQREKVAGNATSHMSFAEISEYIKKHPTDSYKKIGRALGVHFTTVAFCCRKNGIHRVRTKSEIAGRIITFCKENPALTKKAIANHFGVSISYVSQIRKRNGLSQVNQDVLLPLEDLRMFMEKNIGATTKQIAEVFGVSVYTVRAKLRRIGMDKENREKNAKNNIIKMAQETPWASYHDIATAFGVSMDFVRRVLREAGLRGYRRYQIKGWREYEKD